MYFSVLESGATTRKSKGWISLTKIEHTYAQYIQIGLSIKAPEIVEGIRGAVALSDKMTEANRKISN